MTHSWGSSTVCPDDGVRKDPKASTPIMSPISRTSVLTSLELVSFDRSLLNLARRQGCCDTWTLGGRSVILKPK